MKNANHTVIALIFNHPRQQKHCKTQHFNKTLGWKVIVSWGRFSIRREVRRCSTCPNCSRCLDAILVLNHEFRILNQRSTKTWFYTSIFQHSLELRIEHRSPIRLMNRIQQNWSVSKRTMDCSMNIVLLTQSVNHSKISELLGHKSPMT